MPGRLLQRNRFYQPLGPPFQLEKEPTWVSGKLACSITGRPPKLCQELILRKAALDRALNSVYTPNPKRKRHVNSSDSIGALMVRARVLRRLEHPAGCTNTWIPAKGMGRPARGNALRRGVCLLPHGLALLACPGRAATSAGREERPDTLRRSAGARHASYRNPTDAKIYSTDLRPDREQVYGAQVVLASLVLAMDDARRGKLSPEAEKIRAACGRWN